MAIMGQWEALKSTEEDDSTFQRQVLCCPSETFELVPRVALVDRVAREKRS